MARTLSWLWTLDFLSAVALAQEDGPWTLDFSSPNRLTNLYSCASFSSLLFAGLALAQPTRGNERGCLG
ncbi:MAG: hypothetical protein C5B50_14920 [Verrucomicrobia bacterium]|nr:MAG: hypothetical protein C5B50_14920 [Verrucomicrobiota bacterium]